MHSFQVVFLVFSFVQESKQREKSHDGTMTQSDGRNMEAALQQDGWVYGSSLDTFYPRKACNSSKGRQMVNAWTKEVLTCCSISSLTAEKSGIVLFFLQSASSIELLLGGSSFIVLRSRGISQMCHTYSLLLGVVYPIQVNYMKPQIWSCNVLVWLCSEGTLVDQY